HWGTRSSRPREQCAWWRLTTRRDTHFIWRGDGKHCKPRNITRHHHHHTLPTVRQQRIHLRHSSPQQHRRRLGRNNPTMRELRGNQPGLTQGENASTSPSTKATT